MNRRHIQLAWDTIATIIGIATFGITASELFGIHGVVFERAIALCILFLSLFYIINKSRFTGMISIIGSIVLFGMTYWANTEILRDITLLALGFMIINTSASDIRMTSIHSDEETE
jgi:hypothetical protein